MKPNVVWTDQAIVPKLVYLFAGKWEPTGVVPPCRHCQGWGFLGSRKGVQGIAKCPMCEGDGWSREHG